MAIIEANAHIVGVFLSLMGQGVYYHIFFDTLRIMSRKYREGGLSLWLSLATFAIFVTSTMGVVLDMVRMFEAFSVRDDNLQNPVKYYNNIGARLSIFRYACTTCLMFITDAIMVYRTFAVWGGSYMIAAIPAGLLCGNLGTGAWLLNTLAQARVATVAIYVSILNRSKVYFIISLAQNLLCSLLIAYKIWRNCFPLSDPEQGRISVSGVRNQKAIQIVIESAALYCAFLIVQLVFAVNGEAPYFILLDILPAVAAISFSLIIIRVSAAPERSTATSSMSVGTIQFAHPNNAPLTSAMGKRKHAPQPVAVHLKTSSTTETEAEPHDELPDLDKVERSSTH
ncbi:hypothetical protein OF83DRAFT_693509 [Amylostereum chailletii]|nr:hypothetical protein OF83DRAFT_693509 [Amylostereum chailletii]